MPQPTNSLQVPPQRTPISDREEGDQLPSESSTLDDRRNGRGNRPGLMTRAFHRVFSKVWWQFFFSLVQNIQQIWIEIDNIAPSTTASYTDAQTVTADVMVVSPVLVPNDGDHLVVFITQDSTGGWVVTWDTIFKQVTENDVEQIANWMTTLTFVAQADNNWWLTSVYSRPLL